DCGGGAGAFFSGFRRFGSESPLLLITASARSSSPLPLPIPPRALFSNRIFGPLAAADAAFCPAPRPGTVWIAPQYWHRHTPPANASSMLNPLLQLVQVT